MKTFLIAIAFVLVSFQGALPAGRPRQVLLGGELAAGKPEAPGADKSSGAPHVSWRFRLEPEKLKPGESGELIAAYSAAKGWHIYAPDYEGISIPTKVEADSKSIAFTGKPRFPKPIVKEEPVLGETQRLLEKTGEIRQGFRLSPEAQPGTLAVKVKVTYQACTDTTCDPPAEETAELSLKVIEGGGAPPDPQGGTPSKGAVLPDSRPAGKGPAEPSADEELPGKPLSTAEPSPAVEEPQPSPVRAESSLESAGIFLFIILMVAGGLFALVMPCTYPMIPITISFFTKQADARHGKVLPLALAYGAGIILIFNIIGWAFAESITPFAALPLVNLLFAAAFIVFALSLFGLFELRLPPSVNALASRVLSRAGAGAGAARPDRPAAGGARSVLDYVGVFLLGAVLVITSFTCTAPVMGSLLTLAVSAESAGGSSFARVTLGMTVFGATMAAPFVLLSLFPARAKSLPRAGEWMHTLKVSLGFLELAAALKFLSNAELARELRILPRELFLLLWAATFFVMGLYLLSVFRLKDEEARGIGGLRMLFGLASVVASFYFFHGAMGYKLDWITESLAPPYAAARAEVSSKSSESSKASKVAWPLVEDDYEKGIETARKEGKRALINFTGHL